MTIKNLATVLAMALCLGADAAQSNLLVAHVGNYGLAPQAGLKATLTLLAPNPRLQDGIFVRQDPMDTTTDANGAAYWTNIAWGKYSLTVEGAKLNQWTFSVATNTTGTVDVSTLPPGTTPANPLNAYYTSAQVDALLAGVGASTNSLWSTAGGAIYPSGDSGTAGGWTSAGGALYPSN